MLTLDGEAPGECLSSATCPDSAKSTVASAIVAGWIDLDRLAQVLAQDVQGEVLECLPSKGV